MIARWKAMIRWWTGEEETFEWATLAGVQAWMDAVLYPVFCSNSYYKCVDATMVHFRKDESSCWGAAGKNSFNPSVGGHKNPRSLKETHTKMPKLNIGAIAKNVSIDGASMEEVERLILKLGLDSSGVTTVQVVESNGAAEVLAEENPKAARTRRTKKDTEPEEEKPKRSARSRKAKDDEPEEEKPKKSRSTRSRKASDDLEDEAPKRSSRAAKKSEPEEEPEDGPEAPGDDISDEELVEIFSNQKKFKRMASVIEYLVETVGWDHVDDIKEFCLENQADIPALENQRNLETRAVQMAEAKL